MVNVPWLEGGTFNNMYTLPSLPHHEFPSIPGIISLLKYQTLGIIQDRKRN
jgi:hypothetical protein